jgi:hypothetical protein
MARLTKEQWAEARSVWESDPREGFDWLADSLNGIVSRQAISKTAKAQGWKKGKIKKVAEKVAKTVKSCATKTKVAQPKRGNVASTISEMIDSVIDVEEIRPVGRPTLYKPEFEEQVYRLCLLGATDEEIAGFFGVDERTINNWKHYYPEFFHSMSKGKLSADAEIAESLFKKAKGYQYTEVRTKQGLLFGDDNSPNPGEELPVVEIVSTVKEFSPDTGAAFIWLKNRRSTQWKDKHELTINHKIDKEMMDRLVTDMIDRLERSRERQRAVLIERGITIDAED